MKLVNITLTRAEGPTDLCNKPQIATTFIESNVTLSRWARSVSGNDYHKVDFIIKTDESEYKGCYPLQKVDEGKIDQLQKHIVRSCNSAIKDLRALEYHEAAETWKSFVEIYV